MADDRHRFRRVSRPAPALAGLLSAAVLIGLAAGCAATETSSRSAKAAPSRGATAADLYDEAMSAELDLGDDWDQGIPEGNALLAAPGVDEVPASQWSIVLGTFADGNHQQSAATMVAGVKKIAPQLAGARVHTYSKGSMVVLGHYESADDPHAKDALEIVKSIEVRGGKPFAKALLTRLESADAVTSPFALLSVRKRYPDIDPLYTLQIAVWGTFDGELTFGQIRRAAESQVRELRAEGHEAFVHHDPDKELSSVTIGLFNHTAVDAQSGLYSREVEAVMVDFPVHLVNGQPLQEPVDRFNPRRGTRVQTPKLVLVPTG